MVAFFIGSNMYKVGDVLDSKKCGKFQIAEVVSGIYNYKVIFLSTGYEKYVRHSSAYSGSVKDPLVPTVCGVGYVGDSKFPVTANGKATIHYSRWSGMINRCYGKNKYKTYEDATVCKEWFSFGVYAQWFEDNCPDKDNIHLYDVDKDLNGNGSKVYSPETCRVILREENQCLVNRVGMFKIFASPSGERFLVGDLAKFCREHSLTRETMTSLCSGKQLTHKGWRFLYYF